MEHHTLGGSDVEVSVITFGAWAIGGWMWGGTDEEDAVAAIRRAIDLGVTSIDTAAIYGFGRSEELVCKAIGNRRDELQILTKYGLRWDSHQGAPHFMTVDENGEPRAVVRCGRKGSVIAECENSLRRLGTDYIDVFQSHWRDTSTPIAETMAAMEKLLADGKIRAAGLSNCTAEELDEARKIVPIAAVQPPYSMLLRDAEKDLLPYCKDNNVGVVVYSPMQRGLLTGKVTLDRKFGPNDHRTTNPMFSMENRRRVLAFLDDIRPVADAHGATLAQLAVNWTIHRDGVTAALVGARNPAQAEENARANDFTLTEEQTRQINERLETLQLDE